MVLTILVLMLFFGLLNFYYSTQILRRVSFANIKISFFEIRWQVHKHMKSYKQITRSEDGKLGFAWYGYWLSLIAMLATIVWLCIFFGN